MNFSNKIIDISEVTLLATNLHGAHKKIVLVGGCFDVLHVGHISFLEKAKQAGDTLIILLENDTRIKHLKGPQRPINVQYDRARVLAALITVDFVVLLPENMTDSFYDKLILEIKPAIIATTEQDPNRVHKERQAKLSGSKVIDVISYIENASTSRIAELLKKEL